VPTKGEKIKKKNFLKLKKFFLERARATAIVFGSAQMGNIITNSLSGVLLSYFDGWSAPFYFFGGAAVIWFFFFVR
jgi:predicted MFS family arabinose efflux permease